MLFIEVTPGGVADRPNSTFFVLYADGRATYSDWDFGHSVTDQKTAYLTQQQIREQVAFAINEGGMAAADELYEFVTYGPAGSTIITLNSPELTKTVTYQLPPGNLVRDPDPDLGLQLLVGRASFFTHAVNKGMASGGMFLADDERARLIALGDPRFVDLLVTEVEHVDRVVPVPDRPGEAYVVVSVRDELDAWPPGETCDIGGADGPMTGIVWQVDLEERRVLAVSPRWGDVDCLGGN